MLGPDDTVDDDENDSYVDEDGNADYEKYEELYGRDALLDEAAHHPENEELQKYVNESDVSLTNEEAGRDENGEREDA